MNLNKSVFEPVFINNLRLSVVKDLTSELLAFCARIFITEGQKGLQGFPLCSFVTACPSHFEGRG